MTPEQESNLLSAVQTLQDTVARQGEETAVLRRENTKLRARVDALEAESVELKLSVAEILRSQERQDAVIRELQQLSASKDERFKMLQRHLEEQARDALEARRLAR